MKIKRYEVKIGKNKYQISLLTEMTASRFKSIIKDLFYLDKKFLNITINKEDESLFKKVSKIFYSKHIIKDYNNKIVLDNNKISFKEISHYNEDLMKKNEKVFNLFTDKKDLRIYDIDKFCLDNQISRDDLFNSLNELFESKIVKLQYSKDGANWMSDLKDFNNIHPRNINISLLVLN